MKTKWLEPERDLLAWVSNSPFPLACQVHRAEPPIALSFVVESYIILFRAGAQETLLGTPAPYN